MGRGGEADDHAQMRAQEYSKRVSDMHLCQTFKQGRTFDSTVNHERLESRPDLTSFYKNTDPTFFLGGEKRQKKPR